MEIHGRPLKTGPCNPKATRAPRRDGNSGRRDGGKDDYEPTFNRWGDVGADKNGGGDARRDGPEAAKEHLGEVLNDRLSTRLYVGGLGKMVNQAQNDEEMKELFNGFKV